LCKPAETIFISFVLCNHGKDHLWIKGGKSVENAIAVLANEGLHLDGEQPIDLEGSTFWKNDSDLISLAQHYAITHIGCILRVVVLCRELLHSLQLIDESSDEKVQSRTALMTKLLKLLVSFTKSTTFVVSSNQLLIILVKWLVFCLACSS